MNVVRLEDVLGVTCLTSSMKPRYHLLSSLDLTQTCSPSAGTRPLSAYVLHSALLTSSYLWTHIDHRVKTHSQIQPDCGLVRLRVLQLIRQVDKSFLISLWAIMQPILIGTYLFIHLAAKHPAVKHNTIFLSTTRWMTQKYYWKFLIKYGIKEFRNTFVFTLLFSKILVLLSFAVMHHRSCPCCLYQKKHGKTKLA